jgi:hypothetical protein
MIAFAEYVRHDLRLTDYQRTHVEVFNTGHATSVLSLKNYLSFVFCLFELEHMIEIKT